MKKLISKSNNKLILFLKQLIKTLYSIKTIRKTNLLFFDYLSIYLSSNLSSFLIGYENDLFFYYYVAIALPIYILTKQFKPLTRFINSFSFYQILFRNFFIALLAFVFSLESFKYVEIRYFILFLILVFGIQSSYRILIRDFLNIFIINKKLNEFPNKVAIYKASHLGVELSNILDLESQYETKLFIDDNPSLKGSTINNLPIISLTNFNKKLHKIDKVFVASEVISHKELIKLRNFFGNIQIPVEEINPLIQLRKENFIEEELQDFHSNNLINRKILEPFQDSLKKEINRESSICITGAGGSIGSELCRQVISMNPKKLIIIDFCEFNLYKIFEELKDLLTSQTILQPKLLNLENQSKLEKIFKEFKINFIFHTAAYKHVPLVELNKVNGIKNNILSTRSVSLAAINSNVKKVVLISSDKAVRPSNVMGATKLFSELIVKELSKKNNKTFFSIVRFGNVIDSSGSVIPLFRNQIKSGGPLTITHLDMERYFMTISEAVNLVLQASVIMKGGETFILDMGERIKIIDLAKTMIKASGLSVKDVNEITGDIEIKICGMREGEKLKEELIFNGNLEKTIHPQINLANEKITYPEDFIKIVDQIILLIEKNKDDDALKIFNNIYKKI